ncbi:hypothetical protein Ahy_B01g056313 [Arachis hypogaea]|uniref:Replication protein A 70 kDa DNA-binding subunit B/D first OB fold domain-containing protein n=1 Tax=Arachis hypogaea TaxID=3818 RepID=A0A445AYJ0_ARAHY|nr:hypothetical protein Ahy_B01g056313 [Arachis hypogaea]
MAGIHKIADINPTIDNLCVRIRVIRLWTLPSYENSPLPYSIEMVWLDEDVRGKIHASVKKAFVSRLMNLLEEGISYQIRYFGVGLNKGYFKTTHHEYVVNLNQRTDVHRLPESSNVVGYLAGIGNEKTLEKDGKSTKYTVIELEIDDGYRIKLGVIDDSDYACFVVFDKEAKQVLGKSCVEILDPLLLKGDLSDTPTLLLNLIDKTFLFIVEVQISDNPHFSPSYKVKKMTDNVELINKFKEAHPIQIILLRLVMSLLII